MASRLLFLQLSCGETSAVVSADMCAQQQANQQEDGSGKTSFHPPYPVQECHQLPRKSQKTQRQVPAQKALAGKKTWSGGRPPVVLAAEVEKQAGYLTVLQVEKVENQVLVVDPAEYAAETHGGKRSLQVVQHSVVFQSCEIN